MRSFDATQLAIAATKAKTCWWLFTVTYGVTTHRWATAARSWNGNAYAAKLLASTFQGITMHRCRNEFGMLPQNSTAFQVDNAAGAIAAADLLGARLLIEQLVSDGTDTAVMRSWLMSITEAVDIYGRLEIEAAAPLQAHVDGEYPSTRLVAELSPSDADTGQWKDTCLPKVFGTAYLPLSAAWISGGFRYLLGPASGVTYTISAAHSPPSKGESEWLAAEYAINQATYTLNSVDYRTFQPIIADSDFDGAADAAGFWRDGNRVLEIWTKFSTSATGSLTDPAGVLEYVLEDLGVPAADIDTGGGSSFAAATATFAGWGLAFNGGWVYRTDRVALICNLLDQCHAAMVLTDKIELHPRTTTSRATITSAVLEGSFRRSPVSQSRQPDSCYVSWSEPGRIMDNRNRATVPAKSTTANTATETLVCRLVQDSIKAQKLGKLWAQRKFLRAEQLSFTELGYQLALDPDDWITVNNALYGGNYTALVESIRFRADLLLDFSVLRLSDPADDWADLNPAAITVASATMSNMWTAAIGGPDATVSAGGTISSVSNYAISNDNKRDAIADASGVTITTNKTYDNGSVDLKISWTWTGNEYDIDGFIVYGYVVGAATPWVLTDAYYSGKDFYVGSQDTVPQNIFFNSDGTKMYIVGSTNDKVFQYSLSIAWEVNTASYDSKSFSVSGQDNTPQGLFFSPDGTKMYIAGYTNKRIYQYALSTAWDVSTASYTAKNFYVGSQDTVPQNIFFNSDGTKMYVMGYANDKVFQYALSTAWDVSTASYASKSFYVGSQEAEPQGLFFESNGTKMYVVGELTEYIYQYSLSTAWDVSTAGYDSVNLFVGTQDNTPQGLFFKADGSKIYVAGYANKKICQYNISQSYTIGTTPSSETSVTVPANKREYLVQGVTPNLYYVAGIQPFRAVNINIAASGTIKSPAIAQNAIPYQASATPVFFGSVQPIESSYPDGTNLDFGIATGSKIGRTANQKIAFWGATPIVQPSGAGQAAVTLGNADNEIGGLTISTTYNQLEVQALRDKCEELADDMRNLSTLLHAIRTALVNSGNIKGTA